MGWSEAHRRCPEGVTPAVHRTARTTNSVVIAGSADCVTKFVVELQNEGVFTRALAVGGMAFHSDHMSPVAPALKQQLQQVVDARLFGHAFNFA